jgi:hypothetical protein
LGQGLFFGRRENQPMKGSEIDVAKSICSQCPAKPTCLLTALLEPEGWGVWGGLTRPERQRAMERFDGDTGAIIDALEAGILDALVALEPQAVSA